MGRTGCFCAVAIAIEMMDLAKESIIDAFDDDSNILDQVRIYHTCTVNDQYWWTKVGKETNL